MAERLDKTDAIRIGTESPFARFVQAQTSGSSYFDSLREKTEPEQYTGDETVVIPVIRQYDADSTIVIPPVRHYDADMTEVIAPVRISESGMPWRPQNAVQVRNNAQVERDGKAVGSKGKFTRLAAVALVAAAAVGVGGVKFFGSSEPGSSDAAAMVGDTPSKAMDPTAFIAPALDCATPGQVRTRLNARAQSEVLIPVDTKKDSNSLTKAVGYPMFKNGVNGAPEATVELNDVEICFDENNDEKQKNGTLKPFVSLAKDPKSKKNEYVATIHRNLAVPVPKIPLGNCDPKDTDGNAIVVCVDNPGATGLEIGASPAKGIDAAEAKAANEFVRSKDYPLIAISSMQNFTLRRLTNASTSATEAEKKASQVMRNDIWKAFDAQLKSIAAPELAKYGVTNIVYDGEYSSLDKPLYDQYKKSIDDPRVIVTPQITSLTINTETVK